ncbi:hypothetical protein RIR_jg12248.t1 [Rhizophagus irregularis DAOM 181602=DAOM 197198]|nr:hypothetical protein RIR_jg12248.t1 [Rhizophagus irregularis DAOM 181602=DAOM 197198]
MITKQEHKDVRIVMMEIALIREGNPYYIKAVNLGDRFTQYNLVNMKEEMELKKNMDNFLNKDVKMLKIFADFIV